MFDVALGDWVDAEAVLKTAVSRETARNGKEGRACPMIPPFAWSRTVRSGGSGVFSCDARDAVSVNGRATLGAAGVDCVGEELFDDVGRGLRKVRAAVNIG